MASIKKRGTGWQAQIARSGIRTSRTFDSKRQAEDWASAAEAGIIADTANPVPNKTFGALLERYRDEVTPTKKGAKWESVRIGLFLRDPISEVNLRELDQTHFAAWRDRRLKSVSDASVLREWNVLSNACKRATDEWKWLLRHPMKGVVKPSKPAARDRLITQDEIDRLMHSFGGDMSTATGRVGAAFLFAIETGMRAGEICALPRSMLRLDQRFLIVGDGKTAAAKREVPLSAAAIEILKGLPKNMAPVFGLKEAQIDALFRKIRDKAMVEDLHFHDTRHLAITRLARKLNVLELARAIGHRDLRQLMVYYNESAAELAKKL